MPRPVPHALFKVKLADWVRHRLVSKLTEPCLIAAEPWSNFAVVAELPTRELHVLDRRQERITHKLTLPPKSGSALDFHTFCYAQDGMTVVAYNAHNGTAVAWTLNDGEVVHRSKGQRSFPPAMTFMPGGRLAVCDGPDLRVYQLGTDEPIATTPISDDLRSLVLHALPTPQPALLAAAIFRRGLGSWNLQCLRVTEGKLERNNPGPVRRRPARQEDEKSVRLRELLYVPGSTARLLIVSEEECLEHHAPRTEWEYDQVYTTCLLAIDPQTGRFLKGEISIEGRHCLEQEGGELLLTDEMGRRRRVCGFPLRLESADWRLSA